MKKTLLTFGLLLITILTFGQQTKYVDTEELNIRAGAGTKYEVVDKISQGQKVTVLSDQGKWSEIELENGQKGFVSTKFLSDTQNLSSQTSDKKNSWISYFIVIGLVLYGLYKVKKFFSGLFSGSSSSSTRSSSNSVNSSKSQTPKQEKKSSLISDTRVKSNNYIETFDENGKRINGMFLGSNERFVGFSQSCFVTIKSNNYLTTYNADCKRINGMFLGSNEHYHGCAGNTFTTKKDNNYITTYDINCKRVSGRFA